MTSDGTNSFVWNARNQLASMDAGIDTFRYDPLGRRVAKTISGVTTNFLYDGLNPVQELSGTTPTANLLSGGIDEFFTRTDSAGARNFLSDPLGGTVALADSTGTVQTSYTYEPFGSASASGAASANPYQFTGRENDGTGLYFYRARYYSPMLARFVSQDLLGLRGPSPNLYAYADNYPVGLTDPLGLCACPGQGSGPPSVGPHAPLPPVAGRKTPPRDSERCRKQRCLNRCLESQVACETVCLVLAVSQPPPFGEIESFACEVFCEGVYHRCLEKCTRP